MENAIRVVKANKTSLYNLVAEFEPLPKMKEVEFAKVPRAASYFMTWSDEGGDHKAYFTGCAGKPVLSITTEYDGETTRKVHWLSLDKLVERGMTKIIVKAGAKNA